MAAGLLLLFQGSMLAPLLGLLLLLLLFVSEAVSVCWVCSCLLGLLLVWLVPQFGLFFSALLRFSLLPVALLLLALVPCFWFLLFFQGELCPVHRGGLLLPAGRLGRKSPGGKPAPVCPSFLSRPTPFCVLGLPCLQAGAEGNFLPGIPRF